MGNDFQINFSDFSFGPEESEWLLKEWLKDPEPKTINQLAKILLTHQTEVKTGFLPYDVRRSYKEKDKIIVFIRTAQVDLVLAKAEVVRVIKNAYRDTGDLIDVRILIIDPKLDGQKIHTFVANYQGNEFSILEFKSFEVIGEKEETDVIPKLLLALASDKRFANFGEYWLPSELLIYDILNKITDVREAIAKSKQSLSTREILEKIKAIVSKEESAERLEFSLNYFLEQDRRFVRITGESNKWDLRSRPPKVQPPTTDRCTVTIRPEWLEKGVLLVPRKLSNCIPNTDIINVIYGQVNEFLIYNSKERLVKGLGNFYSTKSIAEWDKVHLQLQALEGARLFINCRWKRRLDRLLKIELTDLRWGHTSLRDCIIVVLSKFKTPAHYREIYSEIAPHKQVLLGSIIATLSRYSPSLFVHTGYCRWQLAGWVSEKLGNNNQSRVSPEPLIITDEIWKAIAVIEDNDYVYKLLQKAARPFSFDEICSRLSDDLKVDVNQLRATGFLKPDKRFRRLDNGCWALEEWFVNSENERQESEQEKSQNVSVKTQKGPWIGKLWLVLKNLAVSVNRYYSRFFNLIFRQQILRK
jgi:DNA-directed RNA polymerase delta subunit